MPHSISGKSHPAFVILAGGFLGLIALISASTGGMTSELKQLNVLIYPGLIHQQNIRAAIGSGIFEKNGLNVSLVQVQSGPAGMAAVEGGSIDIGAADSNLPLLSNQKGSDFQIVCGASGLYFAAVTGPSISSAELQGKKYPDIMKVFAGKKLGVTGLGSSAHFFWKALFLGAGMDPESADYVPVGLAASAVQALRTKGIDAYMGFEPMITMVREGGLPGGSVPIDLRPPANEGPKSVTAINPELTWYAKRSFLSAHAGLVKAFNKSLVEAAAWQKIPANFDKLVEIMKPTASIGDVPNKDISFDKMIKDNIPVTADTGVTADGLKAWIAFIQEFAGYPKNIDANKVVNQTIWEDACK